MTTRRYLGKAVLLVLVGLCAVQNGAVWAVSGSKGLLPVPFTVNNGKLTNSYSSQSGLQISVDTTWVGSRGYRPVQVTLLSPKPVGADTQITVRFHASFWRNKHQAITVEQDFEIHQGTNSATATLLVPQYVDWKGYGWEVWVDGKKDEQLTSKGTIFNRTFNQSNLGNAQSAALILPGRASSRNATQNFQQFSRNTIEAFPASATQLPETWIGYANLDVVVAYPEDLEQWSQRSPQQFAEMLRWVRAGGNLWVFDVGENYNKLTQVESSLGLSLKQQKRPRLLSVQQRGWRLLPLDTQVYQGADALVLLDGRKKIEPVRQLSPAESENWETLELAANSGHWFVARAYGLGTVTAFPKPFNQSLDESTPMGAVQRSLLGERINWRKRHGNYPGHENRDFNNLLIPEIGSAPVFEFQLLISLFVIGIGPLNYWVLKRRHQLPLMLVTVPVAALATTVLLFGYGILSDGFSVRVRARSITLIDQSAGEATSWARLSYYAGLAPAKGFQIPDDTVIYPIHSSQSASSNIRRRYIQEQREVEWGEQQKLTRGWLASRTPTQYLTITARASDKRLLFESQKNSLTVTNELGVDIILLAVQDHDGKFYLGKAIDTDASAQLKKSDMIAAMSQLRTSITGNVPEFPAGFVISRSQQRSWNNQGMDGSYPLSGNLMEAQINSVVSPLVEGWGNGAYVAITTAGPELSLGLDDAIETDSFHVVRGSWSNE